MPQGPAPEAHMLYCQIDTKIFSTGSESRTTGPCLIKSFVTYYDWRNDSYAF